METVIRRSSSGGNEPFSIPERLHPLEVRCIAAQPRRRFFVDFPPAIKPELKFNF